MSELLRLDRVTKTYRQRRRQVTAIDDVSLTLGTGQIVCLVGESGSGKTTLLRLLLVNGTGPVATFLVHDSEGNEIEIVRDDGQ